MSDTPSGAEDRPVPQTLLTQDREATPLPVPSTVVTSPPDREPLPPSTPQQVAGYTIEGVLGRGGMGVVYKARQPGLHRLVALKMILHADHSSPSERTRFTREAELLAALKHPNIIEIYEVGEHEGKPFISLEFVAGGSLDRRLHQGPLPWRDAASLVATSARGMQVAHEAGIVHRDLKPANVLLHAEVPASLGSTGLKGLVPKITDFGLAKKLDEAQGLSASGAVMGTPPYMAPEQAAGNLSAIDARTDVYALGAVLYECLTGRPPFRAATAVETLGQVLHEEPVPPRRLQPGIPRDLETICLRCLQKDRSRRYPSANELADDLSRFLNGETIRARPVGWPERAVKWVRRRPVVALLLAIIVLVATGGVGGILLENQRARQAETTATQAAVKASAAEGEKERQRATAETQKQTALREKARAEQALANSELLLAQAALRDGNLSDALDRLEAVPEALRRWEWRQLRHSCSDELYAFYGGDGNLRVAVSPNGQRVVAGDERGQLLLWDAVSGRNVWSVAAHTRRVTAVGFSSDGKHIASADDTGVLAVRTADNGQERLTYRHTSSDTTVSPGIRAMIYSPDSSQLIFTADRQGGALVKFIDATSGKEVQTQQADYPLGALALSPDAKLLAVGGWDGVNGPGVAELRDATTGKRIRTLPKTARAVEAMMFSPDGSSLAWLDTTGEIRLHDVRDGKELCAIRAHAESFGTLAFTPDGHRLISCGNDHLVKVWSVPEGKEVRSFKGHLGSVKSLAVTPDGQPVVSGGSWDGAVRFWDIRGIKSSRRTFSALLGGRSLRGSPDGRYVASGGSRGMTLVDLEANEASGGAVFGDSSVVNQWFLPDGETLLACSKDGALARLNLRLGRVVSRSQLPVAWLTNIELSPDGRTLALYGGPKPQDARVTLLDLRTEKVVRTVAPEAGRVEALAWSPDGRHLATGNNAGKLCVWDAESWQLLFATQAHHTEIVSIDYSPNGKLLATTDSAGVAVVQDAADGARLRTLAGKRGVFSSDSRHLALANEERPIRLWDVETGQAVWSPDSQQKAHSRVAFVPGGEQVVALEAEQIRVWEGQACRVMRTLPGHLRQVNDVAFSPDGQRLATLGWDSFVRLWNVQTGELLLTIDDVLGYRVAFNADGKQLLIERREKWLVAVDATTGQELAAPSGELPPRRRISPDGRLIAVPRDGVVQLISIAPATGAELRARHRWTALDGEWHATAAARAETDGDWAAATFHLEQLKRVRPWDGALSLRRSKALQQLGRNQDAAVEFVRGLLVDPHATLGPTGASKDR